MRQNYKYDNTKTIDYFKESKDSKVKNVGSRIEHALQIFHKNKTDTIIFDAQEAVCFVTGDDVITKVCQKIEE